MGAWRFNINISEEVTEVEDIHPGDRAAWAPIRDRIVAKFKKLQNVPSWRDDDDLDGILDEMADTPTVDDFNVCLPYLYDWCDDHRVWIEMILPPVPPVQRIREKV